MKAILQTFILKQTLILFAHSLMRDDADQTHQHEKWSSGSPLLHLVLSLTHSDKNFHFKDHEK